MLHLPFPVSFALLLILLVTNLGIDLVFVRETKRVATLRYPPLTQYTFLEGDYPPFLPVENAQRSISLLLEESVRYGLTEPEKNLEWTYMSPGGDGNIRLGPNHRFFNTGFSYQLHCAKVLVSTFQQTEPPTRYREVEHVARCLNVLRQFVLCSADTTLEPADSLRKNFTAVRAGGEHRCRDSRALYETMEQNWLDWSEYKQTLAA
ncbi:hypothetical protein BD311DRAFT_729304 [Dichomitus squalens]|uniref:Uncharacterized protein n=1 Tax=Dichomitus squalens TaxID=114155 RepID=A0A4Q9MBH1_9APHY|nr:hypothetical protein BD311DRAFT_729304 [Dichomitus squalens]